MLLMFYLYFLLILKNHIPLAHRRALPFGVWALERITDSVFRQNTFALQLRGIRNSRNPFRCWVALANSVLSPTVFSVLQLFFQS